MGDSVTGRHPVHRGVNSHPARSLFVAAAPLPGLAATALNLQRLCGNQVVARMVRDRHLSATGVVVQRAGPAATRGSFDPSQTATHEKTEGDARLDRVQVWQGQNAGDTHAEILMLQELNARDLATELSPPRKHLLSIRLNRAPCGPCATALSNFLTQHRTLIIRIKASAITDTGGMQTIRNHPRMHFQYWTQQRVEAKANLRRRGRTHQRIADNRRSVVHAYFNSRIRELGLGRRAEGLKADVEAQLALVEASHATSDTLTAAIDELITLLRKYKKTKKSKTDISKRPTGGTPMFPDRTIRAYLRALYVAYHPQAYLARAQNLSGNQAAGQGWSARGLSYAALTA